MFNYRGIAAVYLLRRRSLRLLGRTLPAEKNHGGAAVYSCKVKNKKGKW